jgi:TPR repeat protein
MADDSYKIFTIQDWYNYYSENNFQRLKDAMGIDAKQFNNLRQNAFSIDTTRKNAARVFGNLTKSSSQLNNIQGKTEIYDANKNREILNSLYLVMVIGSNIFIPSKEITKENKALAKDIFIKTLRQIDCSCDGVAKKHGELTKNSQKTNNPSTEKPYSWTLETPSSMKNKLAHVPQTKLDKYPADILYLLGNIYFFNFHWAETNTDLAKRCWLTAAQKGNTDSLLRLWQCYTGMEKNIGSNTTLKESVPTLIITAQEEKLIVDLLLKAANEKPGDPRIRSEVGMTCSPEINDHELKQNQNKARLLINVATKGNDSSTMQAVHDLGFMLYMNKKEDAALGIFYLQELAQKEYIPALFSLAAILFDGATDANGKVIKEKNIAEACEYYNTVLKHKPDLFQLATLQQLGDAYFDGKTPEIKKDTDMGLKYYLAAWDRHHCLQSGYKLGVFYKTSANAEVGDILKAIRYFQEVVNTHYKNPTNEQAKIQTEARYHLWQLYFKGVPGKLDKNIEKAREYSLLSTDSKKNQQHYDICWKIADEYLYGGGNLGTKESWTQAILHCAEAIKGGNISYGYLFGRLLTTGRDFQNNKPLPEFPKDTQQGIQILEELLQKKITKDDQQQIFRILAEGYLVRNDKQAWEYINQLCLQDKHYLSAIAYLYGLGCEQNLQKFYENYQQLINDPNACSEDKEDLQKQIKNTHINTKVEYILSLMNEVNNLKIQLKHEQGNIETRSQEFDNKVATLKEEVEERDNKIIKLMQDFQTTKNELSDKNERLVKRSRELQKENDELKTPHSKSKSKKRGNEYDNKINALKNALDEDSKRIENLEKELHVLKGSQVSNQVSNPLKRKKESPTTMPNNKKLKNNDDVSNSNMFFKKVLYNNDDDKKIESVKNKFNL